jgi:hypothetical protein
VQSAGAWHGSERTCKALVRVMLRVRAHVQSIVVGHGWESMGRALVQVTHGWERMCRALVHGMVQSAPAKH